MADFRSLVEEYRNINESVDRLDEEIRVPGTDLILEDGDKIEVLKESRKRGWISVTVNAGNDTWDIFGDFSEGEVTSVTNGYGEEMINNISVGGNFGRLVDYIKAVNTLLSRKVEKINVK